MNDEPALRLPPTPAEWEAMKAENAKLLLQISENAAAYKQVSDQDDETIKGLELQKDELEAQVTKWRGELNGAELVAADAMRQLRAMVEERDLYSEVVDAAEAWLKHHGNGGISEAEANKALRYQVEQLGEKVTNKPLCDPTQDCGCLHPGEHAVGCPMFKRKCEHMAGWKESKVLHGVAMTCPICGVQSGS